MKTLLVASSIIFSFLIKAHGQQTSHWYPTGQDPVPLGNEEFCYGCCKEKFVDDVLYYLVDCYYPPPPECSSGCIYKTLGSPNKYCFGPGEHEPECLATHNSTTDSNAVVHHQTSIAASQDDQNENESGCVVIRTGPYGNTRDGSVFFTDESAAIVSGDVQQVNTIDMSSGSLLHGFIVTYTPIATADYHGGNYGVPQPVDLTGDKIVCIEGQYGPIISGGTRFNSISQLVFHTQGGDTYGPFGQFGGYPRTQFKQCAPCDEGYLWFFSGYNSTYSWSSIGDVTFMDQLFFHWRCCGVTSCQ